jgi:N-acetylglucosamine kinase-like BadF-type ATPase
MGEDMRYYFGFDGGATRCRLAICDESGNIVYRDEGESSNIYSVGKAKVESTIKALLIKAMNSFQISKEDFVAGCFGSAGLARKKDIEFFESLFQSFLPFVSVYLCSDAEILLTGGLNSLSGICLIGGTGSVCFGRTYDGVLIRSGGFGWRLGDEGSGWNIANEAISRTLKSKELRDLPTKLDKYIYNFFKIEKIEDIISIVNDETTTKSQIGDFAKYVTLAADDGDLLALSILKEAGISLYELVKSVIDRLPENHEKKIVLAGGVIKNDKYVGRSFYIQMREHFPNYIIISNPINNAVDGALLLARTMVNGKCL